MEPALSYYPRAKREKPSRVSRLAGLLHGEMFFWGGSHPDTSSG